MNAKQIGLGVILCDFAALTGYAIYHYGYLGFFEHITANAVTVATFADLVIALSLVLTWMVRDARTRGVSPLPYVLLTLLLGSVGPLVYLIRRAGADDPSALPAAISPARS
jgi:MFS superfamily sulfate permease-like transporter